MISRRRSASPSRLSLPRLSRIIRTIIKILLRSLALSPNPLSFPVSVSSPCYFCVFTHFKSFFQRHMYIMNYKYRQRDAVAPFSLHHIVVVVAVARRFSFYPFTFFFPFSLKFWTELSESVQAAVSACRRIERRENESNILKEYTTKEEYPRFDQYPSHSLPNILFFFFIPTH